jgi:hypothetical protein
MRAFTQNRTAPPSAIIEASHRALGPTRGAVMAVLAVREPSSKLELASVGNVTVELVQPHASRRFAGTSFVLGSPQKSWRVQTTTDSVSAAEALVLHSDGVASRASIEDDLALLREHPVVIAHQLVERFGRDDDDVLVLVAK